MNGNEPSFSARGLHKNRLRQCRLRALIASEAELARRTGIDRTTISALENNRLSLSIRNALRIKEVLGCSLDDLYQVTHNEKPSKSSGKKRK